MDLRLSGKRVVITGASGGIGRALARAFAAEGASLVLHGHRRMAELEAFVALEGLDARTVEADLTEPAGAERVLAAAGGRVDVCVANAGYWPRDAERLDQASPARIRETLDRTLMSALWTARAYLGHLASVGPRDDGVGASLVFIGSTAGVVGEAMHADYAVAKAALHGLVKSLKNEIVQVDPYARVNTVHPGWTVTELVREALDRPGAVARPVRTMALRQLARAEDIARMVVFVSSDVARHLTGEAPVVAGGMEGRLLWEDLDEDAIRARTGIVARREGED